MKTIDLTEMIRNKAKFERSTSGLYLPGERTRSTWPLCETCLKEVDAVNLENVNNKSCEIRAKHHGAEDAVKVTWGVPVAAVGVDILDDVNVGWAIKRAMHDTLFFRVSNQFDFSSKR